jgi:hypothetical protein
MRQRGRHPLTPFFRRTIPRIEDGSKSASGQSNRCWPSVTLINGLDRLDGEHQQGIERAGALTRFADGAMRANVVVKAIDVGVNHSTSRRMGNLYNPRQVQLDPTAFAHRSAGRSSWGTVDAATAHLLPDFSHVLVEFCLRVHRTPSFPAGWDCGVSHDMKEMSKSNANLLLQTDR